MRSEPQVEQEGARPPDDDSKLLPLAPLLSVEVEDSHGHENEGEGEDRGDDECQAHESIVANYLLYAWVFPTVDRVCHLQC